MNKLLSKIDLLNLEVDRLRRLRPELISSLQEKLRIEWIYNSNAIEGNTLTLGETAFFLREGFTSEGKPLKDFLEAKNHAEAIDGLIEILKGKRTFSESLIKELHAVLMRNMDHTLAKGADGSFIHKPLHPGKYKLRPNHVLTLSGQIHHYTDPLHVKDEMEALVHWTLSKDSLHPVEKAALFHYRFVCIHPFDDGNGRLARILMNLLLMKQGYPPCIIRKTSRKKYLETLELVDLKKKTAPFVDFIADELLTTLNTMCDALSVRESKKSVEDKSSELATLNREQRERAILGVLRGGSQSIQQIHSVLPHIKRPTLKIDLQLLVKSKRIKKRGEKKGTIYSI